MMTNYGMLNILNFLEGLLNTKTFPQKVNFALIKNVKTLSKEREIYQESLSTLLDKFNEYFEKDAETGTIQYNENGFPIITDEEKNKEFYDELNELLSIEIDISLYKIDEELLNYNADKYDELSAQELINLMDILCEEKED